MTAKNTWRWIGKMVVSLGLMTGVAYGSSGGYGTPSYAAQPGDRSDAFAMGMDAVAKKDFQRASDFFEIALQNNPNDADAANMLAYSQRMLGHLDQALQGYARALTLRPHFSAAREYLGEAYLQGTLNQIKELRSYGPDGAKDLQTLIEALKEAAKSL